MLAATALTALYIYVRHNYLSVLKRIFVEKPLFIIPRGQRPDDVEDLRIPTTDGLKLAAAYWKTSAPQRKGIIFFGLEFCANRWSFVPYCEHLRAAGYDVFTYEPRNQGDSDVQPGYDPLQWVTDRDAADCKSALRYLQARPDAQGARIGIFGISKGGSACIAVASTEPAVRSILTDGAFATYSTMVPYMRHWFSIYDTNYVLHGLMRPWFYGMIGRAGMQALSRERHVRYISLESTIKRIGSRPLLMIHGEKDSYIKPSMARRLFDHAPGPKEFWLVENAKHNLAIEVAGDEYRRRVLEFFDASLANEK